MRDSDAITANASRCRDEADTATLHNVRDRCLRAEAAWTTMALRSRKTEQSRDAREARALSDAALATFASPGT